MKCHHFMKLLTICFMTWLAIIYINIIMWSILRSDQDILYQCVILSALKRSRKILCGNYDLNNLYYKLLSFRTFSAIPLFNTVFLIEQYRRVCEPHCSRCVKQNILLPPRRREKKSRRKKNAEKKQMQSPENQKQCRLCFQQWWPRLADQRNPLRKITLERRI